MAFTTVVTVASKIKAKGLKALEDGCYIALGRGDADWDDVVTQSKTFSSNTFSTTPNIAFLELRSSDDVTTYVKNVDYSVNEISGTVTRLIDGDIPNNATVNVDYRILGKFNLSDTELFDEIGRKKAAVDYVVIDSNGAIELDAVKYSLSVNPTNLVYCRTTFNTGEAVGENVREVGLFFNTTPVGVSTTVTKTFAESQVSIVQNIRNVIVKTSNELTTYVEGTDYVVDYDSGLIFRLTSGDIGLTETVKVTYKTDPEDYIEIADVSDTGMMFAGHTFSVEDRDSQGNWTRTFLISLTE